MKNISLPLVAYDAVSLITNAVRDANDNIKDFPGVWFEGLLYSGDEIVGSTFTSHSPGQFEFCTDRKDHVAVDDKKDNPLVLSLSVLSSVPGVMEARDKANQVMTSTGEFSLEDFHIEVRLVADGMLLLGHSDPRYASAFTLLA